MRREYARAPRGEKVEDVTRGGLIERLNVVGAVCGGEHFAVECYRHPTNAASFERWFEDRLLAETPKGYTIIMDNASFHRKGKLSKLARGKVRLLFLPPYSPDYNPIEKTWANMKRFLRNNMEYYVSVDSAIYDYF